MIQQERIRMYSVHPETVPKQRYQPQPRKETTFRGDREAVLLRLEAAYAKAVRDGLPYETNIKLHAILNRLRDRRTPYDLWWSYFGEFVEAYERG
jgi:hypothetical protein